MRPVSNEFRDSQQFGEGATQGVVANSDPNSGMGYYVWLYGNYQPFGHAGKDIACPIGTPIRAIADGTVLYAGWTEDLPGTGNIRKWLFYYNFGGIITVIQHDGWISAIAHQSTNDAVKAGDRVKEGQLIGLSGNTKTRTTYVAPHVHTEALVYLDYRTDARNGIVYGRVDPTQFFGSAAIAPQGTITPTAEEDDMSQEQFDILNAKLERNQQLLLSFQAAITDPQTGYVGKAALAVLRAGAAAQYVKGDGEDTIYAREANGLLRGITKDEWDVATAAGATYVQMAQSEIDEMKAISK